MFWVPLSIPPSVEPRTDFNEINGVFIAPQGGENLYKILKAEQKKQRKKRRRLFFQQKT